MKQRNQSIDILRGISIFIIIWSHVCLGWLLDEVVNVTVLGVFFCISGYFYKPLTLGSTLKKKSVALLKPWLIFSLLGYGYSMAYYLLIDHTPFRWDMIPVDLIKGCDFEANIPCWFFICLFEIFVIYSFLQKLSLKVRTYISIILFIVGSVLLAHDINNLYIGKALFYLSFLHTGFLIKYVSVQSRSVACNHSPFPTALPLGRVVPLALLLFVLLLVIKVRYIDNVYFDFIIGYICAIIIFTVMLALDQEVKKYIKNPVLVFVSYVGKNSLTIFALHIITNSLVWRLLYPYFHTPDMALSFFYAIISLMLCLPFIPVYNFLFGPKKAKELKTAS